MIAPIRKQTQKAFLQAFHVTTTTRSRRPQSMWITVVVSLLQTSRSGFGRGNQSLRRKECVLRSGDLYRQTVVVAQNMSRGPWEIWAWCWNLERPTAWPIHWWHQKKPRTWRLRTMNGNPQCSLIGKISVESALLVEIWTRQKWLMCWRTSKNVFSASVKPEIGLLRCKEDFDSIYHESCTMQPKTMKTEICCCRAENRREEV